MKPLSLEEKKQERLKFRCELLEKQRKAKMMSVGEFEQRMIPLQATVTAMHEIVSLVNVYMQALIHKELLTEEDLQAAQKKIQEDQQRMFEQKQ